MKMLAKIQSRPLSELDRRATTMWVSEYACECGAQCVESSDTVACPECKVYWRTPVRDGICIDDQEVA